MARKIVAAVCILATAAFFIGCESDSPSTEPQAITYATSVILGTWIWDVDADALDGAAADGDLWLSHQDTATGAKTLVPQNSATALQVYGADFDAITAAFVQAQPLTGATINASNVGGTLTVGSIVVFQTTAGTYGKFRVLGYRESQDFTFGEAALLTQPMRDMFNTNPNVINYHLEVEWELFR